MDKCCKGWNFELWVVAKHLYPVKAKSFAERAVATRAIAWLPLIYTRSHGLATIAITPPVNNIVVKTDLGTEKEILPSLNEMPA